MKPRRIFLIRHGESIGNIDKEVYKHTPDYALPLSNMGNVQAEVLGHQLKKIIGEESVAAYYSPFFRARRTCDLALNAFTIQQLNPNYVKAEPRIVEQEWCGKLRKDGFMHETEAERDAYGHFLYRFEGGESCADVYYRVSDFFNTLHRDFEKDNFPANCLIFGHGMTNRLIIMKWFHLSIEEFEMLANPKNCEFWQMDIESPHACSRPYYSDYLNDKYAPKFKYKLITTLRKYDKPRHNFQYTFRAVDSITRLFEKHI